MNTASRIDSHAKLIFSAIDLPEFIDLVAIEQRWDEKIKFQITLALEELVVNALTHGQTEDGRKVVVNVAINRVEDLIDIHINDNGVQFDPTAAPEPDVTAEMEDREIGGLGVYLVKKMMDSVQYRYSANNNQVVLTKRL
jgi:serine/threonine-protein kinase RsbW